VGQVRLEKDKVRIVSSDKEEEPLKLALKALQCDLARVIGYCAAFVRHSIATRDLTATQIVIINLASGHMKVPGASAQGAGWI
jgi:hypothetical protein